MRIFFIHLSKRLLLLLSRIDNVLAGDLDVVVKLI